MPIYCDESGGVGSGVLLMAALSLPQDVADTLMARMVAVLGLRGELKGSRISHAERAFVLESLVGAGARAIIVQASIASINAARPAAQPIADMRVYAAVLDRIVTAWLPRTGGCVELVVDDGRYYDRLNRMMQDDTQRALGQWGNVRLADSKGCAGVQFADVVANSFFHMATGADDAPRIAALTAPYQASGAMTHIRIDQIND
ncbi:MAG: DUF3800 domain-containing protein [Sphingopyxis sp.]